ncbi:MAG: ABC transporter permease, partial [Spirochaetales bacterium]|nr:ABC transporter permease [Spirochaetales bacterium]
MRAAAVEGRRMPRGLRELNAVITILWREIFVALKTPSRIVMALVWPVIMLGMFGSQLSQNMGVYMDFDFNNFMLVGMLVNGLFMMTMMGVTTLVEDRQTSFTQEILVAPVSRFSIILGKITGASLISYLMFFSTIIIGFITGARIGVRDVLALLAVSPLICLAAGSLGVFLVSFLHKSSAANFAVMFLSMGQMFLSGALVPVNHSTGFMAVLSRALPMTYCIDFARGVFYQNQG